MPRKPLSFRRAMLRSRRSWTRWLLKRTLRLQTRERARLVLLLRQTDQQHLRLKELQEQEHLLGRRLLEMAESQQFRESLGFQPKLVLPPLPPEVTPEELRRLMTPGMLTLPPRQEPTPAELEIVQRLGQPPPQS